MRWHTEGPLQMQTLADHQWGVAMLAMYLTDNKCTLFLVRAALVHDCAELIIGDIPAPTKWKFGSLLEEAERKAEEEMGITVWLENITPDEQELLSVADRMEALLFSYEELLLGNTRMQWPFEKLMRKLAEVWARIPQRGQEIILRLCEDIGFLETHLGVATLIEDATNEHNS